MLELARVLGGETAVPHDRVRLGERLGGRRRRAQQLARNAARTRRRRDRARRPRHRPSAAAARRPLVARAHARRAGAAQHGGLGARRAGGPAAPSPPGLGGQLMHLAFPMSLTEQAPFNARGAPAVLSRSRASAPASGGGGGQPGRRWGRSGAPSCSRSTRSTPVPTWRGPSAYLVFAGKLIPAWAIRLLVLVLIAPVVITTVDGLARARRRGPARARLDGVGPGLRAGLRAGCARRARGPRRRGAVAGARRPDTGGRGSLHTAGIATLAVAAIVIALGLCPARPLAGPLGRLCLSPAAGSRRRASRGRGRLGRAQRRRRGHVGDQPLRRGAARPRAARLDVAGVGRVPDPARGQADRRAPRRHPARTRPSLYYAAALRPLAGRRAVERGAA